MLLPIFLGDRSLPSRSTPLTLGRSFLPGCWRYRRRTSQGAGGCSPPDSGKTIIFGQKLNFSGRSQQPKMKKVFLVYLLDEKTEFILSSETKCPKSGIFTNNYWVG